LGPVNPPPSLWILPRRPAMKQPLRIISHLVLASLVVSPQLFFSALLRADDMKVQGTALYREGMTLPPAAVLEAILEDISRADARAETLGRVHIENPGSPPFSFEITYDPARIQANHSYAVRARITVDGRLLFTTDQVYPVLTRGHGDEVELLLRRTGGGAAASRAPLPLPATFAGDLPCADCPGQRVVLTLFADHGYRLRRTYRGVNSGTDADSYELGRWQHSQDGTQVTLHGSSAGGNQYRLVSPDRLRQLDTAGKEIDSALNYDLERQTDIDAVAGPMQLRGLYTYMADAASFNECRTGKRYPVSLETAHIDMEQRYLALTKDNPGAALLATVKGRFEQRTYDPSAGSSEHLIVERFERFWPGETCAREALAQASLTNTYWRPVEIDGEAVILEAGQREPHFVLASEGKRVQGSTGCNRIMGSFEQDPDGFRFEGLASTRMACPPAIAQLEIRFLDALNAVASQRVIGESLELRDASGQLRMRLESRYLR
jgi:copper homeostasis protein (lipoprotein)